MTLAWSMDGGPMFRPKTRRVNALGSRNPLRPHWNERLLPEPARAIEPTPNTRVTVRRRINRSRAGQRTR